MAHDDIPIMQGALDEPLRGRLVAELSQAADIAEHLAGDELSFQPVMDLNFVQSYRGGMYSRPRPEDTALLSAGPTLRTNAYNLDALGGFNVMAAYDALDATMQAARRRGEHGYEQPLLNARADFRENLPTVAFATNLEYAVGIAMELEAPQYEAGLGYDVGMRKSLQSVHAQVCAEGTFRSAQVDGPTRYLRAHFRSEPEKLGLVDEIRSLAKDRKSEWERLNAAAARAAATRSGGWRHRPERRTPSPMHLDGTSASRQNPVRRSPGR